MVHEFTVLAALMNLAGASVAGCFGLLMCRRILTSTATGNDAKVAAISALLQDKSCLLNSSQRAAVFLALCESTQTKDRLKLEAHFSGFPKLKRSYQHVPLAIDSRRVHVERRA